MLAFKRTKRKSGLGKKINKRAVKAQGEITQGMGESCSEQEKQ